MYCFQFILAYYILKVIVFIWSKKRITAVTFSNQPSSILRATRGTLKESRNFNICDTTDSLLLNLTQSSMYTSSDKINSGCSSSVSLE